MERAKLKRFSPKERNLFKGALRRLFSRSDLRRNALKKVILENYFDPNRPRAMRWGYCMECGLITPAYLLEVDHVEPIIRVDESLEDLTIETLVDRIWCNEDNLMPLCKPCHKEKTKAEAKLRRMHKNAKVNESADSKNDKRSKKAGGLKK
jgi:5-methylcytosine-specific restriction endonuclease McrA